MFKTEGRFFRSQKKSFEEIVFFVHFFEGSPAALRKQIQMVNQIGYDAYAFELPSVKECLFKPFNSNLEFGIKKVYTSEIEKHLNQIPDKKMIYSFSNPSASAIEAIANRYAHDIKALICDSGPSFRMYQSGENLLRWNKNHSWLATKLINPFFSYFWSPNFHGDTPKHLSQFPKEFPVLTLLAGKDLLIPPEDTELGFNQQKHLRWENHRFPEAGHLLGIKSEPERYRKIVSDFFLSLVNN